MHLLVWKMCHFVGFSVSVRTNKWLLVWTIMPVDANKWDNSCDLMCSLAWFNMSVGVM